MRRLLILSALLIGSPAAAQAWGPADQLQSARPDLSLDRWRAQADVQAAAAAQAQADTDRRLSDLRAARDPQASPPPAPYPRALPDPKPQDAEALDRERTLQRQIGEIDAWLAARPPAQPRPAPR